MKILITGGSGFIGSNYIHQELANSDNTILNLDKLTYAGNKDNLISLSKNSRYQFMKGDICDYKLVSNLIKEFDPDSIVHFAAESHVDRSIESPLEFVRTNILGTTTLLDSALKFSNWKNNNKFRFLHISTDEVFGTLGKDGLFTEDTPYKPSSPYSASKASSDHLVRSWFNTFSFPILITNCSNNYGPYQFPEKLIPLMIANCLDEKPLPIYGAGENIRDWLYVKDHCNAIKTVLKSGTIGETYNIGGNNEIKNIDIVKLICSILDKLKPLASGKSYSHLITFVKDRPGHDFRYAIDSTKIKRYLNWEPNETFETGIRNTIKWYLDNEIWWRKIQKKTYSQERLGLLNV
jgi:dTDP-glucose 4,6-dehydratase